MRIRHKPYAKAELAAWPFFVDEPAAQCGNWAAAFANPAAPLRLELGCGKGTFLAKAALRDGDANHLGVDIKNEMLVVAKRNMERLHAEAGREVHNALLCAYNIENIDTLLAPADGVERIYINFCNPWTKAGAAKHRLTHPRQLVKYRDFLSENGEIWFKTDSDPLFEDSLRYFEMLGFTVTWHTRDLHSAEPEWNIRTEHENMFSSMNIPIKACIAKIRQAELDKAAILRLKDV